MCFLDVRCNNLKEWDDKALFLANRTSLLPSRPVEMQHVLDTEEYSEE